MLSILIPIYNQSCLDLVKELYKQSFTSNILFEIICIDDCSPEIFEENKCIENIPNCTYTVLEKNIGRSKIRNLLAEKAQYEYLIFLDCDSEIPYPDFIEKYFSAIQEHDIVAGGTIYASQPPEDSEYYLHWKYGTVREPKPTGRQTQTFTANNFILKKSIFKKVRFNENIQKYGHEDSLFQIDLIRNGYSVFFISNPVIHTGLEKAPDFIKKTKTGIGTLWELYKSGELNKKDSDNLKLLKTYLRMKKYKCNSLFSLCYLLCRKLFEKNLLGKHPNLFILDIYKLCYLSYIVRHE